MKKGGRLPHRTVHSDVSKKMWTAKADNGSGRYVTNEKFGSGHRERALELNLDQGIGSALWSGAACGGAEERAAPYCPQRCVKKDADNCRQR